MWASVLGTLGTSCLALLVAYLLGFFKDRQRAALLARIPGPKGSFLLGNAALMAQPDRHHTIAKLADQFGGSFLLNVAGNPFLVVADPAVMSLVLGHGTADLPKQPWIMKSVDELVHPRAIPNLDTSPANEYWRAVRKCIMQSFSTAELREDFEVIKSKVVGICVDLSGRGPDTVVDVAPLMLRLSLDVLGLAKLGYNFNACESQEEVLVMRLIDDCLEEWKKRLTNPLRTWTGWFIDDVARGQHRYSILQDFVRQLWAEIKARGEPPDIDRTLAAQLMRCRDPKDPSLAMAEDRILSELGFLLLAGHETSGNALTWALYCLAKAPAMQDLVHAELCREGVAQAPELLEFDSLGRLTYLDACIRESMRMHPVGAEGSVRVAEKDMQVGPHMVPKGTSLWCHFYAMHRSQRLWQDADTFMPDRWLAAAPATATGGKSGASTRAEHDGFNTVGGDGEGAVHDGEEAPAAAAAGVSGSGGNGGGDSSGPQLCNRRAFVPFGMGQRSCPGQALAQVTIKTSLAILLSVFRFELASADPAQYAERLLMTMSPMHGMRLVVTPRPAVDDA